MGIKGVLLDLNNADPNIGTMVGNTLKISDQITQYQTCLNRTFSVLEPLHMTFFHLFIQTVNNFLQRFNVVGKFRILILKNADGQIQYIGYRPRKYLNLTGSFFRKFQLLVV